MSNQMIKEFFTVWLFIIIAAIGASQVMTNNKTVQTLYVHAGLVVRPETDESLAELKAVLNKHGIRASLRVSYDNR